MIITLYMTVIDEMGREVVVKERCTNLTYETIEELSRVFNDAGMDSIDSELTKLLEGESND